MGVVRTEIIWRKTLDKWAITLYNKSKYPCFHEKITEKRQKMGETLSIIEENDGFLLKKGENTLKIDKNDLNNLKNDLIQINFNDETKELVDLMEDLPEFYKYAQSVVKLVEQRISEDIQKVQRMQKFIDQWREANVQRSDVPTENS